MAGKPEFKADFRIVAIGMFGFVVVVGVIMIGILVQFRPDASATLINAVKDLLTMLSGFAVLAYGLHRVDKKVDTAVEQTNGNLTRRDNEIARQSLVISDLQRKLAEKQEGKSDERYTDF